MNRLLFCILVFFSHVSFGQEWQKSIRSARDAYQKGDYERATRLYNGVDKKQLKNINLSSEFGQSAYRSSDFTAAQRSFEQATNNVNGKQKAAQFHNLGNSLMKQKKYDEAIAAYKNALRLSPNDRETQYNLSEALRNKKNNQSPPPQNNQKNQPPPPPNNAPPKPDKSNTNKTDNKIPSKSVDRMLDQLMKAEAETKRKLAGSRQQVQKKKNEKDW